MFSFGDLGRFFKNSLMHCLAERPRKIKIIYFLNTFDSFVIFTHERSSKGLLFTLLFFLFFLFLLLG
jgi:hypothetical protein